MWFSQHLDVRSKRHSFAVGRDLVRKRLHKIEVFLRVGLCQQLKRRLFKVTADGQFVLLEDACVLQLAHDCRQPTGRLLSTHTTHIHIHTTTEEAAEEDMDEQSQSMLT
jgi:hypothetical protein